MLVNVLPLLKHVISRIRICRQLSKTLSFTKSVDSITVREITSEFYLNAGV